MHSFASHIVVADLLQFQSVPIEREASMASKALPVLALLAAAFLVASADEQTRE
jgi:hypothetical protein